MKNIFLSLLLLPFLSFSQSGTEKEKSTAEEVPEKRYSIDINSDYKYNTFPSHNTGIDVVYSHNKWKVNTSLNYGKTNHFWDSDVSTFYPDESFIGTRTSYIRTVSFMGFIDIQYQISEKTKINFFSKNEHDDGKMKVDDHIKIYDDQGVLDRDYLGYKTSDQNNDQNAINLLLTHNFNKKNHFFTIETDWMKRSGWANPTVKGQDYAPNGTAIPGRTYDTYNDNNVVIDVYSLNGMMNIPSKWFDLAVGGKWVFVESDYDTKNYINNNGDYELDLALSPLCKYIENRQTAFTDLKKTVNKWDFKFGLKFENTLVKGFVTDTDEKSINKTYTNLLPALSAKYSFEGGNKMTFSYRKTMSRPIFRFINPATGIYNAYENYTGNPFVNPSISHNLNLSYSFKPDYSLGFSYVKTKDNIGALTNFNAGNIMGHKVLNYLDLDTYQLTLNKSTQLTDFLEADFQLQGFYKSTHSLVSVINDRDIWGWYGKLNNQFYLNKSKTISGDLNFWYLSKTIDREYVFEDRYALNFGMKFLLLNQNLTLNINVTDALQSVNEYAYSTIDNIHQDYRNYWQPRSFKIAATYKFGNKKLNYNERMAENATDHNR
ncbi:outer membrane beta-barrel family protein [Flavobacterium amniphilum]|uniref:outer membrane beta-barrel family protein n=1 Tax=Flavobacterium amniphilum TaxID=1834035 RepID=UPI00202ABE67|nr:outer membrane beta-barrel family protein [Flavobacterium amniphilum]MCL9807006.1 outer membrane beta-barrel family protein [Flavobacterium amniphilum]